MADKTGRGWAVLTQAQGEIRHIGGEDYLYLSPDEVKQDEAGDHLCPYCRRPMAKAGWGNSGRNKRQLWWCGKCRRRTMRPITEAHLRSCLHNRPIRTAPGH